jgi:hypothetical protein
MAAPTAQVINIGGFLPMGNAASALAMDRGSLDVQFNEQQNQGVISGLAGHIR